MMKSFFKYRPLLAFAILLQTCAIFAQQSPTLALSSQQRDTHIGQQAVDLTSPNSSLIYHGTPTSDGHLKVDKTIQLPNSYLSNPPTTSSIRALDQSLKPGVIKSSRHVDSRGAFNYEIPLQLPPGIGNMSPKISFVYNSSAGDGIMGMGWSISGVSVIRRVPKDILHNGIPSGIEYNTSGPFSLDGNRLSYQGVDGQGNPYFFTENETFSRITLKSTSGGDYFEMKTKDGLTITYGGTPDATEGAPRRYYYHAPGVTTVLGYHISKVTDNYGNYIEYSYYNYANQAQASEIAIKEIKYTGNATFSPFNSVKFYYDLKATQEDQFFMGDYVQKTLILREVDIFSEASQQVPSFNYNLIYSHAEFDQLNEIVFSGMNSERMNSTVFVYGDPPTQRYDLFTGFTNLPTNADYAAADFNEDGLSDLMCYIYNASSTDPISGDKHYYEWRLYMNDGVSFNLAQQVTGNFIPFRNFATTYLGISSVKNGFILANVKGAAAPELVYSSDINGNTCAIRLWEYNPSLGQMVQVSTNFIVRSPNAIGENQSLSIGDFDGDSRMDLMSFWRGPSQFELTYINFETNTSIVKTDNDVPTLQVTELGNTTANLWTYNSFSAYDFDQDGFAELIGYKPGNDVSAIKVSFNGSNFTLNEIWQQVINLSHSHAGDYDGDGYVDYISETTGNMNIMWGTGFNLEAGGAITGHNIDLGAKRIPMDINSDGKTDLVEIYSNASPSYVAINACMGGRLSSGFTQFGTISNRSTPLNKDDEKDGSMDRNYDGFSSSADNYSQDANQIPLYEVGDFDGNGTQDLLFKVVTLVSTNPNVYNSYIEVVYFNQVNDEKRVTHIFDGKNNEIEINYFPLPYLQSGTAPGFTKSSTAPNYPLTNAILPIIVVGSIGDHTGVANAGETYDYYNLQTHYQGRGILGFDKITKQLSFPGSNDVYQTTEEFDLDLNYFVRKPKSAKKEFISTSGNKTFFTTTYNSNLHQYSIGPGQEPRFFSEMVSSSTVDGYLNSTTTKAFTYDYSNGNLLTETTNVGSGKEITQEVYSSFTNAGSWISNVPQHKTTTITRAGESPYVKNSDYAYDATKGSLTNVTEEQGASKSVVTAKVYDQNTGVLVQETVSAPNDNTTPPPTAVTTYYNYDPKFRFVEKVTSPLSYITSSKYDPVFGNMLYSIDVDGLTTRYAYDNFGGLTETEYPDGTKTKYRLDWFSSSNINSQDPNPVNSSDALFVTTKEDADGRKEVTTLDKFGRVLKTETTTFNTGKVSNLITYNGKGEVYKKYGPYLIPLPTGKTVIETTNQYSPDMGALTNQQITDGSNILTTSWVYNYNTTDKEVSVITASPDGKTTEQITDETGKLIYAIDNNNGALTYEYHYDGTYFTNITKLNSTVVLTEKYDNFGHLFQEIEPNSGTKQYVFNSFGLVKSMIDNKGTIYSYDYDLLGRLTQKVIGSDYYNYIYNNSGLAKGQLNENNLNNGKAFKYTYDDFSRLTRYEEFLDGQSFLTQYEYDNLGRICIHRYPNNFFIKNEYANGDLIRIKNGSTNSLIWQLDELDNSGSILKFTLGNGIQTVKTYDNFGNLVTMQAGSVQNLACGFNILNGNLNSVTDNVTNYTEGYGFDNLDRLTTINNSHYLGSISTSYDGSGNITSKYDAGAYTYHGTKTNQVIQATNSSGYISTTQQDVSYNLFDKPTYIEEGVNSANIYYDPDGQRYKTTFFTNSALANTRYYLSGMDRNIDGANAITDINYVAAPTGLCGMFVGSPSSSSSMYYIYNDHMNNVVAATDGQGNVAAQQNFDAWGRRRDVTTHLYSSLNSIPTWLYRGYTGHEHLPQFSLINMNSRLYDPTLGRMLSPDPVLADGTNSQAYNKYSYAYNNPLKFGDPSGNTPLSFGMNWYWNTPSQGNLNLLSITSPGGGLSFLANHSFGYIGNFGSQTTSQMDAYSQAAQNDRVGTGSSPQMSSAMLGPSGHVDANFESQEAAEKEAQMLLGGMKVYSIHGVDNLGRYYQWYTPSSKAARAYMGRNDDHMESDVAAWVVGDAYEVSRGHLELGQKMGTISEIGFSQTAPTKVWGGTGPDVGLKGGIAFLMKELPALLKSLKGLFQASKAAANIIPEGKLANHLFKGAGKLMDNPANRALIQKISNGKALGVDAYGKAWYTGVDAAGKSIYSYTQNGVVKGAGYMTMTTEEMVIKYGLKLQQ